MEKQTHADTLTAALFADLRVDTSHQPDYEFVFNQQVTREDIKNPETVQGPEQNDKQRIEERVDSGE